MSGSVIYLLLCLPRLHSRIGDGKLGFTQLELYLIGHMANMFLMDTFVNSARKWLVKLKITGPFRDRLKSTAAVWMYLWLRDGLDVTDSLLPWRQTAVPCSMSCP